MTDETVAVGYRVFELASDVFHRFQWVETEFDTFELRDGAGKAKHVLAKVVWDGGRTNARGPSWLYAINQPGSAGNFDYVVGEEGRGSLHAVLHQAGKALRGWFELSTFELKLIEFVQFPAVRPLQSPGTPEPTPARSDAFAAKYKLSVLLEHWQTLKGAVDVSELIKFAHVVGDSSMQDNFTLGEIERVCETWSGEPFTLTWLHEHFKKLTHRAVPAKGDDAQIAMLAELAYTSARAGMKDPPWNAHPWAQLSNGVREFWTKVTARIHFEVTDEAYERGYKAAEDALRPSVTTRTR